MSNNFLGIDMTQVDELAVDMLLATSAVIPALTTVVEVGSYKIKKAARENIEAADVHGRLKHYPNSITYDVAVSPVGVTSEIGPEKDKPQGPLGNVLEYGTSVSAPVPHLNPALEAEAPIAQAEMAAVAGRFMIRRRHP